MKATLILVSLGVWASACSQATPSQGSGDSAAIATKAAATPCANCGQPLEGLSPEQLAQFEEGLEDFEEVEGVEDGLGPVFNDAGCAVCHNLPDIGGTSEVKVTRFGAVGAGGVFDPLANLGGSLRQDHGIGELGTCGVRAEITPPQANVVANRRTSALFGLGLLEGVPDALIVGLAATQPASVRGTVNWLTDLASGQRRVGRFGWKGQVATLLTFAGDAYLNEMGITSPIFAQENCPQGNCAVLADCDTVADPEDDGTSIRNFANFMRMLAPPKRGPSTVATVFGELLFASAGCATCHTPVLVTGASDIAPLNFATFQPYTDLLLHDMGALGDGITQGLATGRLMRTPPLWGVSAQPFLLHDGRAATLDEAIRAHDGQARASRDSYAAMSATKRSWILAFLRSL